MRAQETTILDFIGGLKKVFIIPPFQRNYEWRREQCDDLFNDILKACKTKKPHYLGNIVYYVGNNSSASYNEFILIDGQQRVTTILILLCAIRDAMDKKKNKTDIDDINKMYLKNEGAGDTYRVRLKQTDYDNGTYARLVDGRLEENETNKIAANYRFFKESIKNALEQQNITPKELYETIPNLEVVGVNLQINSDLTQIQTIFEKINSTGMQLTSADLLRNYLLLSNSSQEQERLYKNYWVKIEEKIPTDYISVFVRDYLVMKIKEDVEKDTIREKKTYKRFISYVTDNNLEREEVLKDMLDYASYYKMILKEDTKNPKLNREIAILKFLNSDDMYCLFMYLLKNGCADKKDLLKTFNILRCFLTRYRIVAPSSGGGAMRFIVQNLIRKFESENKKERIECTSEAIYKELSNSPNFSTHYPDDEEFKDALKKSAIRNYKYGKALLLAVEEKETSNIVPFKEVTIEHLMPQNYEKWIKDLGGKDNAGFFSTNYLNCIGNLAPLSSSYNSQNSNKKWSEKVKIMQDVQFKTTKEVLKCTKWGEEEIVKRNNKLAERICKAVLPPLKRTRPYLNQKNYDEVEPGKHSLSEDIELTNAQIDAIYLFDEVYEVFTWRDFLNKICEIAYNKDSKLFEEIVSENKVHKTTSKRNAPDKDPIISKERNLLNTAKQIGNTNYYSESTIGANGARDYAKQILDFYGLADDTMINLCKQDEE